MPIPFISIFSFTFTAQERSDSCDPGGKFSAKVKYNSVPSNQVYIAKKLKNT